MKHLTKACTTKLVIFAFLIKIHQQYFYSALKSGVWSPGQRRNSPPIELQKRAERQNSKDEPIPPVWTPRSAGSSPVPEKREFRPVNFESPVLGRKNKPRLEVSDLTLDSGLKTSGTGLFVKTTLVFLESEFSRQFSSRTTVESTVL